MKIIIFGIGKFFQNKKAELYKYNDDIVAFVDNKIVHDEYFEGHKAYNPSLCTKLQFDKIVLMGSKWYEMGKQLYDLGVETDKVRTWEQYRCDKCRGEIDLYIKNVDNKLNRKILVVSTDLNYNGGTLAAIYAVQALMKLQYNVCLAVPTADEKFLLEVREMGINIAVVPGMPHIAEEELYWINGFDVVIVNVFQMIECAYKINRIRPVLWWIHEPIYDYDHYEETLKKFPRYRSRDYLSDIYTVAVSDVPKQNFNSYYPNVIKNTMAYGIPDEYDINMLERNSKKFVFAIVGGVTRRKAQKIFVDAARKICDNGYSNVEFWLIGGIGSDVYSKSVRESARNADKIKFLGLMSRHEIHKAFKKMDVLVCTSIEDPLPIVVTEGMMHGKVCIVSETVGQASMIKNGENGFVTKAGDVEELYHTMEWVLQNKDKLDSIKEKSRELYEKNFTMEKFCERLEHELLCVEKLFYSTPRGDRYNV